jgi:hypothetical protein
MRTWMRRVWLWGPVALQMAVIFTASSIPNLRRLPGGVPDWFVPGRSAELADVLADTAGAVLAAAAGLTWRLAARR